MRMKSVPHDRHVTVTPVTHGGAVERGTVVMYQPQRVDSRMGRGVCHGVAYLELHLRL